MKKRVLIVDDSAVARRLLRKVIEDTSDLEVSYSAPTVALALDSLGRSGADVVLLDLQMPDADGLSALLAIKKRWPSLPVIMCSAYTERGAPVTLESLAAGADDYITKPVAGQQDVFAENLIGKLRCALDLEAPAARAWNETFELRRPPSGSRIEVLAIGSSTGGPHALAQVFSDFSRRPVVPILIAQHMPPVFTTLLAQRIEREGKIPTKEAEHGEVPQPGVVYIAPGGRHMTVVEDAAGRRLALNDDPPEHFCRPAVDVLFRGVAKVYGSTALACVLTGMGRDGTASAELLADCGATVIVQHPSTCVVPSMPASILRAGAAHAAVPLRELGADVSRRLATAAALNPQAVGAA